MENYRRGEARQDGGDDRTPTGTKTTCNIAEMLKRMETAGVYCVDRIHIKVSAF